MNAGFDSVEGVDEEVDRQGGESTRLDEGRFSVLVPWKGGRGGVSTHYEYIGVGVCVVERHERENRSLASLETPVQIILAGLLTWN